MTPLARARAWFLTPSDEPAQPARDHAPLTPAADPPAPFAPRERSGTVSGGPPAAGEVSAAAVLGRPGEAEPVAAAVALTLRARAAIVAVVSGAPPAAGAPGSGGTPAARRLAARLGAHGLAARPRGRLVWLGLSAQDAQVAVRRIPLMGAPVVTAVTAARTPALDELLAEQDLIVVVATDPAGPLARLALAAHANSRVLVAPPLGRGPARSLARRGLRPARSIRELVGSS